MKEVTREIVKDLLPLYAAGEASDDSRAAVEEWLRADPELARLAAELKDDGAPTAPPRPTGAGRAELTATKSLLRKRAWLLAFALLCTGLPLSFVFDSHHLLFWMVRDSPIASATSWVVAIVFWIAFFRVSRKLRVTGL